MHSSWYGTEVANDVRINLFAYSLTYLLTYTNLLNTDLQISIAGRMFFDSNVIWKSMKRLREEIAGDMLIRCVSLRWFPTVHYRDLLVRWPYRSRLAAIQAAETAGLAPLIADGRTDVSRATAWGMQETTQLQTLGHSHNLHYRTMQHLQSRRIKLNCMDGLIFTL